MGGGFNNNGLVESRLYPVTEKDVAMERVPQFIMFQPDAPILALSQDQVEERVSWMDFVAVKVGFTSTPVGFPAGPGRWNVEIQDVGGSRNFQPRAWNITAAIGTNTGTSDSTPLEFPVPWVFLEKTTIRVIFEELTGFDNMPSLVLIGFLTNWEREAAAAQAHQELQLRALRVQAGEVTDRRL